MFHFFKRIFSVKKDIEFLSKCWKLQGRPIYAFVVREQHLRGPQRDELLELLSQFKQGHVDGIPVRMGRLQTLVASACIEHLDFLDAPNQRCVIASILFNQLLNTLTKISTLPNYIAN